MIRTIQSSRFHRFISSQSTPNVKILWVSISHFDSEAFHRSQLSTPCSQ